MFFVFVLDLPTTNAYIHNQSDIPKLNICAPSAIEFHQLRVPQHLLYHDFQARIQQRSQLLYVQFAKKSESVLQLPSRKSLWPSQPNIYNSNESSDSCR